jgi:hypothetical protein
MVNVPTALPMRQLSFPFRRGGHGKSLRFSGPATLPGNPGRDFVTISADYMDKQAFIAAVNDVAKRTRTQSKSWSLCMASTIPSMTLSIGLRRSSMTPRRRRFLYCLRGHPLANCAYAPIHTTRYFSRDAIEELLDTLARQPRATEVNVLAHSMGNWITLEALRGRP